MADRINALYDPELNDQFVNAPDWMQDVHRKTGKELLKGEMWRQLGVDYTGGYENDFNPGYYNDSRTPQDAQRMRSSGNTQTYEGLKDRELQFEEDIAKNWRNYTGPGVRRTQKINDVASAPVNAMYNRDDPFGYGSDETERLRQSMTHAAPDGELARRIARDKAIFETMPGIKQTKGLWNALTSPMGAEEAMNPSLMATRAADLGMLQLSGAGFQRPSGNSLGVFAGPGAKTANQDALRTARAMHYREGAPMEDVWRETGWFKGADEKWKFEIPDTNARLDPVMSNVPLNAVLEHPELFKAYPQLRDYQFKILPENSWYQGSANHYGSNPSISLRPDALKDESVMLHELQHPIQQYEGFAKGGSPLLNKESPFVQDLANLDKAHSDALRAVSTMKLSDPQFHEKMRMLDQLRTRNDQARALHFKYMQERKKAAFENYSNLAGEVEARNVQTRWGLSPLGVYETTPPWQTESVPRSNQIISFDSAHMGPRIKTGQGNILLDSTYEKY